VLKYHSPGGATYRQTNVRLRFGRRLMLVLLLVSIFKLCCT